MDPQPLQAADWARIASAMVHLYLFLALAIVAALAMLLARGILPSLVESADAPPAVLGLRRFLVPIGVVAGLLMLVALVQGLAATYAVLSQVFPRYGA